MDMDMIFKRNFIMDMDIVHLGYNMIYLLIIQEISSQTGEAEIVKNWRCLLILDIINIGEVGEGEVDVKDAVS